MRRPPAVISPSASRPILPGARFATLLFLAGADARRVAVEITIDPRPGPLARRRPEGDRVFRLAVGPALLLTTLFAAGIALGIVLGHHAVPGF